jgi:hypothetical protein
MIVLLALALVVSGSVQYDPASPTVGDLITVTFPDPGEGRLSLLPSDQFEVVDVGGARAVVRTFRPGTIRVVAETLTPGQQTQRHSVEIEVRSVLAENDDLRPAPLVLPKKLPPDMTARWAIGFAAAAALVAWVVLWFVSQRLARRGDDAALAIDPAAAWIERLRRIARLPDEQDRWRQLADSTRWLLPRIDSALGPELTSTEVVDAMRARRLDPDVLALVERILHGGDWAKFSPFGAPRDESASLISSARKLADHIRAGEAA